MSALPLSHAELSLLDDAALVRLAQDTAGEGDAGLETAKRAEALVLLRYRELVRTIIAAKVQRDAVDDLWSEASMRFVRTVRRGAPIHNPAGLLVRIAQRVRAGYLDRRGEPLASLDGWDPAGEDGAFDAEASQQVCDELLSVLDDRQREVVWMRIVEQRPSIEVAAGLDTTPGNVDVILFRALRRIREAAP